MYASLSHSLSLSVRQINFDFHSDSVNSRNVTICLYCPSHTCAPFSLFLFLSLALPYHLHKLVYCVCWRCRVHVCSYLFCFIFCFQKVFFQPWALNTHFGLSDGKNLLWIVFQKRIKWLWYEQAKWQNKRDLSPICHTLDNLIQISS